MNYNKFTREQVILISLIAGCGNLEYNFSWIIYINGKSGWLISLIGALLSIPFSILILYLCRNYDDYTIFDIVEMGVGKIVSKIIFVIYVLINMTLAVCMLSMFTQSIKMFFLKYTPAWLIISFIIFVSYLILNNNTLLFGRAMEALIVINMACYNFGISLGFVREFKFENILPIFDTSTIKAFEGILFTIGGDLELALCVMVMVKHIYKPYKHKTWIVIGFLLWACLGVSYIFIMQGMTGYEQLLRTSAGNIAVARNIFIGDFIRGLEIFILTTSQLTIIAKLSIYLYSIWTPMKKWVKEKYNSWLLFVISILILLPSLWLDSYNTAFFISVFMYYFIMIPFTIIVIVITCISTFVIKRKSKCVCRI